MREFERCADARSPTLPFASVRMLPVPPHQRPPLTDAAMLFARACRRRRRRLFLEFDADATARRVSMPPSRRVHFTSQRHHRRTIWRAMPIV